MSSTTKFAEFFFRCIFNEFSGFCNRYSAFHSGVSTFFSEFVGQWLVSSSSRHAGMRHLESIDVADEEKFALIEMIEGELIIYT